MRAPDGTHYDLHGPSDGPCVVLIHGLGLCRALWDPFLDGFPGYRVLTYDLYGHGDSRPTPRVADLRLFAQQIVACLDDAGIRTAHLIGFSVGGMINRRFALDFPGRTLSLTILNSPHARGDLAQQQVEARARTARDQGTSATLDAALQRWFTPDFLATDPAPDRVRDWRRRADPESYAQTAWVLAHGVRELIHPDPPIAAPTLVMTSEQDVGSTPDMSRAIAAEISGAALQIVPGLKHLGLMENRDAFLTPIRAFLDQTGT